MWLYKVMKVLVRVLLFPLFFIRRYDKEKIPAAGKLILVGNHRCILDPLVMSTMTKRFVRFMAKQEVFEKQPLAWCAWHVGAFPINRGTADLTGIKTALSILKDDGALLIFPEGTRNPNPDGPLLPLHDGVALLALKSGARIVPFYVGGSYRPFAGLRLTVGDAIDLSDLNARRVDKNTMETVMLRVRHAIHNLGGIEEKKGEGTPQADKEC